MLDAPPDMLRGDASGRVLTILSAPDQGGAHYWLDGGWGSTVCWVTQTRAHSGLDLVVHRQDVGYVTAQLTAQGYHVIRDWLPTSISFRDRSGHEVHLHPVDPTTDGGDDRVLPGNEGTWHYAPPVEGPFMDAASGPPRRTTKF